MSLCIINARPSKTITDPRNQEPFEKEVERINNYDRKQFQRHNIPLPTFKNYTVLKIHARKIVQGPEEYFVSAANFPGEDNPPRQAREKRAAGNERFAYFPILIEGINVMKMNKNKVGLTIRRLEQLFKIEE